MASAKPLPAVDPTTQPYWEAARQRRLVIQRCRACGRHIFYPRIYCPHCLSEDVEWVEASGRGEVYAFTVVYRSRIPGYAEATPYVVALIDLEEGVRLLTNVVECAPDEVRVGMPVEVCFEERADGFVLPQFRPRRDRLGEGGETR
ncbi:MAG: Zn-ribbon domain-containing OB-fold protein [Clostridia bacterium]|nr:Zn-ribbon domain-containing OB-fold protein [Clostridia bacterium]